jgi:hypothetical protein
MGLKYEMEQRLKLANLFGGTFVFFSTHRPTQKNTKEPPSQRTKTDQNGQRNKHNRQKGSL